jgi:uncharacterized protein YjeT (DUF2065 family)
MGVGFFRLPHGDPATNPPYDQMVEGGHRFIRGNHDNPGVCRRHTQFINDGTVENDTMFIGGGLSIDRPYRTEHFSWWADEELSIDQLVNLTDVYRTARPSIMVTHDCPEQIALALVQKLLLPGVHKLDFPSRTRQAFQSMFELHKPKLWIFGHWHLSFDQVIDGTRFVCLAELECRDLSI